MKLWKKYTDPILCVLLIAIFIGIGMKYYNAKYKEDLFEAIKKNDIEKVKSSLSRDRILTIKDEHNNSALHLAVIHGRAEIVRELIIEKRWQFTYNDKGHMPLHIAAILGEFEIFNDLLLFGNADINAKTAVVNCSLLHTIPFGYTYKPKEIPKGSLTDGHLKIARFLLDYGCDIDARTSLGDTALFLASEYGAVEFVEFLIINKASVDIKDPWNRHAPLHVAVMEKHLDVVITLLAGGVGVNEVDCIGHSALHYAVCLSENDDCYDIVDVLLKHGADKSLKSKKKYSPLDLARDRKDCENPSPKICQLLEIGL